MTSLSNQRGSALLPAILLCIFGILLAWSWSSDGGNVIGTAQVAKVRGELDAIRRTVRDQIDCKATLGFTTSTPLPLNCASFPSVTLKRQGLTGSPELIWDGVPPAGNHIGKWSLTAKCQNNEVVVRAIRPGKDPLKRLYSQWPEATDLFRGEGGLCSHFFDGADRLPCQPRLGVPFFASTASCPAGTHVAGGGCFGILITPGVPVPEDIVIATPVPATQSYFCAVDGPNIIVEAKAICCDDEVTF